MSKRIAVINSLCYNRNKSMHINAILGRLKDFYGAELIFTKYPGHIKEMAGRLSGARLIIAIGGDGTISEIVNGMDIKNQSLAIIPLGSGNSLARELSVCSAGKAVSLIGRADPLKIDLIECRFRIGNRENKRYAVATSGIGYAYEVTAFANRYLKPMKASSYPVSATVRLFNQKPISAKVQLNRSSARRISFTNLMINNTKYAGPLKLFPRADIKDSMLNILYARTNAVTQYLHNLSVITGTYIYAPGKTDAIDRLEVDMDEPHMLMLDGEAFGPAEHVSYFVASRSLNILN